MTGTLVGILRLGMAFGVMAAMATVGYLHRSPWIIALAAPAFTVLYALGKWPAWRAAWRAGGARQVALAALTTLPIQAVVAAVPYLVGLGIGMLAAGPAEIAALSRGDALFAGGLLAVGAGVSALIIRLEGGAGAAAPAGVAAAAGVPAAELELDVDPTPLTPQSFFVSAGYWRQRPAREALEGRGATVDKAPRAASEAMIAAAEAKLGIRLPATLRQLYGVLNGGYVGWTYVALKPDPAPVYDDWRGAFSIDYSSLVAVDRMRSVAQHYDDFTDDPEEIPANADRMFILQARYGDMTLLDYADGPEPRVLIVDFDKRAGGGPVDVAFDDFDAFFAALRRERSPSRPARPRDLGPPLGEVAPADRARQFWGEAEPHPFAANAAQRKDGSAPKPAADDALIVETEARLGVRLPAGLKDLYRFKNGGGVCHRFAAETAADGAAGQREVLRRPVPLEHMVSLAALSDRIAFPPGETPWRELHAGAERLIVIEGDETDAVLLDYRDRPDDGPALLLAPDLDDAGLAGSVRYDSVDALLLTLRFQKAAWDDVAKPLPDAPGRAGG